MKNVDLRVMIKTEEEEERRRNDESRFRVFVGEKTRRSLFVVVSGNQKERGGRTRKKREREKREETETHRLSL